MKPVALRGFGLNPDSEAETFLAIGTGSSYGEDYPCVGRVLLFSITTTSRMAEGGPEEVLAPRLALHREFSHGGVTCVDSLRGYIVLAVGNTLEMHYKQVKEGGGGEGGRFGGLGGGGI